MSDEVIWHDVECGDYAADLPLWEELADAVSADKPIMELGCGTGRVTLHLARRGAYLVLGVDSNPELVAAVWDKSGGGVPADAEVADVRDFEFYPAFELVIAPMQLIQLLGGRAGRLECLRCVASNMPPGGRAAFAIVEEPPPPPPEGALPPLPDVRQLEGWIYSSLPLEPLVAEGSIIVRRLRQTVSPDGELSERLSEIELRLLSAEALEEEGAEAGLYPAGRRTIPATETHVGSTVVLLEKGP
jgi:SAM-dependent methyltransferase